MSQAGESGVAMPEGGSRAWAGTRLVALKTILLVVFVWATNPGVAQRVAEIGPQVGLFVFVAIWLLALAGMAAVAFLGDTHTRVLWGIVFALSAAGGGAYIAASGGQYPTILDIEVLLGNPENTGSAIRFYGPVLGAALAKSLVGFLGVALPPVWGAAPGRRSLTAVTLIGLAPFAAALPIVGIIYLRGGEGTGGLPVQITPAVQLAFLAVYDAVAAEPVARGPVTLQPAGPPTVRNIVVVVDESVRGDFLDINAPDGVRSGLSDRPERLANFGIASSGTNCSNYSNAILRFGGPRSALPTAIQRNPSMWAYARHAGFRTYLVEAQQAELKYALEYVDRDSIDVILTRDTFAKGAPEHAVDAPLARLLGDLVAQGEGAGKLIFVVKNGIHFPFEDKYPPEHALYTPRMSQESIQAPRNQVLESPERVRNSYRNALAWNAGGFFGVLGHTDLRDTAIIYTSDHGQKLDGHGAQSYFTHCNTTAVDPNEGVVPLLVLTDHERLARELQAAAGFNRNRASHVNVYPTVLALMGYDRAAVRGLYGSSLFDRITDVQAFIAPPFQPRYGRPLNWVRIPRNG